MKKNPPTIEASLYPSYTDDDLLLFKEEIEATEPATDSSLNLVVAELAKLRKATMMLSNTVERMRLPAVEILNFKEFSLLLRQALEELKRAQKELSEREKEEFEKGLVEKFLPLHDALHRMVKYLSTAGGVSDSLKTGLKSIYDLLITLFHSMGVDPIPAEGERFDPHLHVAIATVESSDMPNGAVVEEKLRGFYYKGKVLRFAEVVIVKNPEQGRE